MQFIEFVYYNDQFPNVIDAQKHAKYNAIIPIYKA